MEGSNVEIKKESVHNHNFIIDVNFKEAKRLWLMTRGWSLSMLCL